MLIIHLRCCNKHHVTVKSKSVKKKVNKIKIANCKLQCNLIYIGCKKISMTHFEGK